MTMNISGPRFGGTKFGAGTPDPKKYQGLLSGYEASLKQANDRDREKLRAETADVYDQNLRWIAQEEEAAKERAIARAKADK